MPRTFLSGRTPVLILAILAVAVLAAVTLPGRIFAQSSNGSGQESAGVRAELSHLAPGSASVVSSQTGSGGQGALPPINGTLMPKYSTANAQTYALPSGMLVTRVYATPSEMSGANGISGADSMSPLISGYSPSCTLSNTAPTTSSCNQTMMLAGYNGTTKTTNRALIQFSLPKLPVDEEIGDAQLGLYVGSSTSTSSAAMGAYRATTEWGAGATWNTTNGTTAWKAPGGDYSTGADATVNPAVGASKGWAYWYPTHSLQEWYNGASAPNNEGASNFGLLLKDVSEGSTNNDLTFETPASGERKPVLTFSWFPRGIGKQSQFTNLPIPLTDKMSLTINAASGNLGINNSDLHINGTGLPLEVHRTWNSLVQSELKAWYGYGWYDSNRPDLNTLEGGSVAYRDPEGVWFSFTKSGKNFIAPPGIQAIFCSTESEKPCPTLPGGVAYRVIYNQSQVHIDFSSQNLPLDVQDRYGNTITYPAINEVNGGEEIADTQGRHDLYQWQLDSEGFPYIGEITDNSGARTTSYNYENGSNGHHHLTSYKDASGHETKYGYTGDLITQITTPRGEVVKLSYTEEGQIKEIVRTTNTEHTTGPTIKFTYYEVGKAPSPCTAHQKATVVTDPDGVEGKAGHTTTYCANLSDEVETTADSSGNKSESSFNKFARITSTTAAAPGSGESGNVESLGYDESGLNLLCVVTGTSTVQSSCPSSPNKSLLVTSFSYKDEKNPFSATQAQTPEAHSTFACYNEGHQEGSMGPACPTTASGPAGSLQNENNQLTEQHELKFAYNSNGSISSSTDADSHSTSYEYDTSGNLKKITPPTGSTLGSTTITVDADSRPHVVTDGAGHIETITYDKLDRITEIASTGTGTAKTVKFEYDSDGNIRKREDSTGTTQYTVDPLNRVTKEELPGSLSNSYEYDAASNMLAFTDGGGKTTYKYNGLNELESMTEPGESKSTTFAYDNDHRLNKITYASGAKEVYKLEPTIGRPETITAEGVTGTTVPKLTYAYKEGEFEASLVQKLTDSSGNSSTYSYDQLNRLKSAVTTGTNPSLYEFKLDGAGNRTQQTVNPTGSTGGTKTYYVVNSGNLLTCRQTVAPPCSNNSSTELSAYTFDGAGNETAITPKSDTSGTTFAYNAARELSSLTPSGSGAQALSYGGTGQDDLVSIGASTTLQNSQLGLTREVTSAGTSYYARTPNGVLIDQRTPSGHYNPLYDAQGDIIGLVNSSAKVERTFRYGPYGENTHSEGTQTIPYPFGFKSGYRMPGGNTGLGNVANGLYHFGQRYYDPTTGRWTQPDPRSHIASSVQGNRFLFAGADPINLSDPFGLSVQDEGCHAAGGVVGGVVGVAIPGAGGFLGVVAGAAFDAGCELGVEEGEEEEEG